MFLTVLLTRSSGASQTAAQQRLRFIAERARTRWLGWHAFRHYAGTLIVRQTGNLECAARHLRRSTEITRAYARWKWGSGQLVSCGIYS